MEGLIIELGFDDSSFPTKMMDMILPVWTIEPCKAPLEKYNHFRIWNELLVVVNKVRLWLWESLKSIGSKLQSSVLQAVKQTVVLQIGLMFPI